MNSDNKLLQVAISFDHTGMHGNLCDSPADRLQFIPFTNDIPTLVTFIQRPFSIFGGDVEALYEQVLQTANGLKWQQDAVKILIVIGDQGPCTRHQYAREKLQYVDWEHELLALRDKRVQVYSIQALSNGNVMCPEYKFYQRLANTTDGIHMQLQQFSQIADILEMIVLGLIDEAANTQHLDTYKEERKFANHGMLNAFSAIKRQPQDEQPNIYNQLQTHPSNMSALQNPRQARQSMKSTHQLDMSAVPALVKCPLAKYQVIDVEAASQIDEFVRANQLTFKIGYGFYEFTQPSIIQDDKIVVVYNKITGELYEGDAARQLFGIKKDCKSRQKPIEDATYSAYIQSTSFNRKLLAGTKFLYIAQDYMFTSSDLVSTLDGRSNNNIVDIKPSYVPVAPQQQQDVKDSIQNVRTAIDAMKTQLEALKNIRESLVNTDYADICTQFVDKLNGFVKF